jgi:hypothetical protein
MGPVPPGRSVAARMSRLWISMAEMIDNLLDLFWLRRAQAVTVYGARYMSKPQGNPFDDLR